MSKITSEQAKAVKIVKARYFEGMWIVIANDEDNMSYVVKFRGDTTDTDETILFNTFGELIKMEKQDPIVLDEPVIRDLGDQTPTDVKLK